MQAGVKERYDTFIANLLVNGMNGALAVRDTPGYSNSCARQTARRLITNDYIKKEIAKKQGELVKKQGYSIEQAEREYEAARALAMQIRRPAAAAAAVTGKARLYGMDKDSGRAAIAVVNVINYAGSAGVTPPPKVIDSKEL